MNIRLTARGVVDKPPPRRATRAGAEGRAPGTRAAWFGGRELRVDVYERDALPSGTALRGPAIVEEFGATTVVPPGWGMTMGDLGDLLLERT